VKIRNETERSIYAAAYVSEFQRLHEHGVHAEFWRQADAGEIRSEDVVRIWEENCVDLAIDAAESLVVMHRAGARRRKGGR
jgi:hypothetical protein